jgi:hypothetical protein
MWPRPSPNSRTFVVLTEWLKRSEPTQIAALEFGLALDTLKVVTQRVRTLLSAKAPIYEYTPPSRRPAYSNSLGFAALIEWRPLR